MRYIVMHDHSQRSTYYSHETIHFEYVLLINLQIWPWTHVSKSSKLDSLLQGLETISIEEVNLWTKLLLNFKILFPSANFNEDQQSYDNLEIERIFNAFILLSSVPNNCTEFLIPKINIRHMQIPIEQILRIKWGKIRNTIM